MMWFHFVVCVDGGSSLESKKCGGESDRGEWLCCFFKKQLRFMDRVLRGKYVALQELKYS